MFDVHTEGDRWRGFSNQEMALQTYYCVEGFSLEMFMLFINDKLGENNECERIPGC